MSHAGHAGPLFPAPHTKASSNRVIFAAWGKNLPRRIELVALVTGFIRKGACVRALGQESLRSLNPNDRSAGLRPSQNVWRPRTVLPKGAFSGSALHLHPSRTAVSSPSLSAPSSSHSANPGGERGVSRLPQAQHFGARRWPQLEDGVHHAEAPSSVVNRHALFGEQCSYP